MLKRLPSLTLIWVILIAAGCHKKSPLENEYSYPSVSKYIQYSNWHQSSIPVSAGNGQDALQIKGYCYWFNPPQQVAIHEIWPDRKINTRRGTDRVSVLNLVFYPNPSVSPSTFSWAGIQMALPHDSLDPAGCAYLNL